MAQMDLPDRAAASLLALEYIKCKRTVIQLVMVFLEMSEVLFF